ncbi:MAG: hypothetical protein WAO12_01960 [Venatoribacter sp.]
MKTKKLMKKLSLLFNRQERKALKQRHELKDALAKIKCKQKELEQQLECCQDAEAKKELEDKISILETQRRKGLDKLRNPNA